MLDARLRLISLVLLAIVSWPSSVFAAGLSTPTGISLSPFEQQLSIAPNDPSTSFNLTVTNHTTALQELDLTTHDFGSLNDTGGVLLEGSNSYTEKYGLASWITLGTDTVILQPDQSQVVPVTITNRQDLAPGGHYGAIVASVNGFNSPKGNIVTVDQQLLSLVFLDKVGGNHFALNLTGLSQNGNWLHLPSSVSLTFQNPGNVYVVPRGLVKLISPGGTVVAQGIINSGSAFVLPETFRQIPVSLVKVGSAPPLPGLYHIQAEFRYDQINYYATKTYAVKFIDLGLYLLIGLIVVIIVIWLKRRNKAKNKTSSPD